MTEDDKIDAEMARQLLDDPMLKRVLRELEQDAVNSLVAFDAPADTARLLALTIQLQSIRALPDVIKRIMSRGTERPAKPNRFA